MASTTADESNRWLRHAPVVGLLAGAALGLTDMLAFGALGVSFTLHGQSVWWWVLAVFAGTDMWLGWLLGRLLQQRAGLRRQHEVIVEQYDELERHGRQLAEAERLAAIGSMAAGVAHEVRNPLGVIRSSAALAAEDLPVDGDAARALEFVVEEVDRLDAFVGQLLDFARPLTPGREAIAFVELARAAVRSAGQQLEAAGCAVEIEPSDLELVGDRDLLINVLVTGLVNASQALSRGVPSDPRITLRARCTLQGEIVVEIADNGPGLDERVTETAFEPFVTTRARGTGLGLAMARRIVEAHGGRLAFAKARGLGPDARGACLQLRLPDATPETSR